MKNILQLCIIVTLIWGCVIAAPIFGLILGTACAAWVIAAAWQESRHDDY
jgi:hypothetical protein